MAKYSLTYEDGSGLVICRVYGPLFDGGAHMLASEMRELTARARAQAPRLRFLFDNSQETMASSSALDSVIGQLRPLFQTGDRCAILVSNNLMKANAKQKVGSGREIFISEAEAMAWLDAGQ